MDRTDTERDATGAGGCCSDAATLPGAAEVSSNRSATDAQIDALEARIGTLRAEIAQLRRARPREAVGDYTFTQWDGATVRLSQLFGEQRDLILVHNMGRRCDYCTLWADGFVGLKRYLESRAAFVVTSPDPPDVQAAFARARGWTFRMVSAHGTTFFRDMGFADQSGDPMPGVSVFARGRGGSITRVQRAEFGPGDAFCPVWHFFDLLAEGVNGWEPRQAS